MRKLSECNKLIINEFLHVATTECAALSSMNDKFEPVDQHFNRYR